MLEFIREKMQGVFATVIVGFFCAAFALWGVERLFNGSGKSSAVAIVNGDEIYEPEVGHAIEMLRQRYTKMLGGQVDPGFLNDKMLRGPALDSLISRKLLASQTQKLGMGVGSVTVDRSIVSDPTFSRDGKTFDPDYYKEQLRNAQLTAAAYQQQLRQQLMLGHLQDGISNTAFVTEAKVRDLARLMAQKRSFEYVRFPLQQYADATVVTDDAINAYYKDHASEFMTDETVAIEYIEITKGDVAKNFTIDDAELHDAYEKEKKSFKSTGERRAAHILIDAKDEKAAKAKIEAINKKLKEGTDFAALVKQYSIDEGSVAQGGDVGFTSGNAFVPAFEEALAGLQHVGDVSAPVKTEFGYHIIKLLEDRQTQMPSFEKRRADLEAQLRQAKAGTAYTEKVDQLTETAYSAGDLNGPAKEMGLTVQKTAPFTKRGGTGIAGQQKVIDAAFSADLIDSGKNSQVIEVSGDRALVLRVAEHHLPVAKELASVKSVITEKLKHENASVALQQKIIELKARAEAENSLKGVATAEKHSVVSANSKTRTAGGDEAELVAEVFKLSKPAVGKSVFDKLGLANGDQVLIRLTAVEDVAVTPDSAEYKAAEKQLAEGVGSLQFAVYEQQLRSKADITSHDAPPAQGAGK